MPADASVDAFSRRIYQYDIASDTFTRLPDYRTEVAGHFVSDVQALDNHRLVVIERDGGRGLTANFRNVYVVDLNQTGTDGGVVKTLVVELAAMPLLPNGCRRRRPTSTRLWPATTSRSPATSSQGWGAG